MKNLFKHLQLSCRIKNNMTHELFSYSLFWRKTDNELRYFLPPNDKDEYENRFFRKLMSRDSTEAIYYFLDVHFSKVLNKEKFLEFLKKECSDRIAVITERRKRRFHYMISDLRPKLQACLDWVVIQISILSSSESFKEIEVEDNKVESANEPVEIADSLINGIPLNDDFEAICKKTKKIRITHSNVNNTKVIVLLDCLLNMKDSSGRKVFKASKSHLSLILSLIEGFEHKHSTILSDYTKICSSPERQQRFHIEPDQLVKDLEEPFKDVLQVLQESNLRCI